MSTKIYNAFRFKEPGYHWDALWEIQDLARNNIKESIKRYYLYRLDHVVYTDEAFDKDPDTWGARMLYIERVTSLAVRAQAGGSQRDPFDVECSITVSFHEGRLYLRAFCDRASVLVTGALDFLEEHEALEDYHYQNQADFPDDVTSEDWEQRKKDWEAIFSGPGSTPRQLSLNIMDAQSWWMAFPSYEWAPELRKDPPVLTPIEELAVKDLAEKGYLSPEIEASWEPGRITGLDFYINLDDGVWTAHMGSETQEGKHLKNLVRWVKDRHLSPEEAEEVERLKEQYLK